MKKYEKIIIYDDPNIIERKTITGWVSKGCYFGENEHLARWNACTHLRCECGKVIPKSYTKCLTCRKKISDENYLKLPFREWNGEVVVSRGDDYFMDEEDLINYCEENELDEIELLFCRENRFDEVTGSYWEDILPEERDGELPKPLQEALDNLNEVIYSLGPCSYSPSNTRTIYKLKK